MINITREKVKKNFAADGLLVAAVHHSMLESNTDLALPLSVMAVC